MIKDKYTLKLSVYDANWLLETLSRAYNQHGHTKHIGHQLPLLVILPFYKRLLNALVLPKDKIKVSLLKTEALSFYELYMSGIIITNRVTSEINTTIHKTL